MWLRKSLDGSHIPRWTRRSENSGEAAEALPYGWPGASADAPPDSNAWPERTPVRCHCGGVNLVLRSACDLASKPAEELPFFVDPETFQYLATFDACDSCRLSFGTDISNWTFTLLSHIEYPAETELGDKAEFPRSVQELVSAVSAPNKDPRLGTLSFYRSSPDVERFFCLRCAAAVFYACDDRADMVDLAVGLLDHPSGARAEGLLKWNFGVIGWRDSVKGGWRDNFVQAVAEESEEWRIQRGYSKTWARVKREEKEKEASAPS